MTAEPLFSVIVTTYNRPQFLTEAVGSVQRQTIEDFECIIVDDAGPTPARAPSDRRFRVVRHASNRGETNARNTGLAEATGRYAVFLDDDDMYTPRRLEYALRGLDRAPVSICWRRGLDGSLGGNRRLEGHVGDVILDTLTPQLGQVALERWAVPRFDDRFAAVGEVEWMLRITQERSVASVPEVGLLYRTHAGPRHGNGLLARLEGSFLLLEMHGSYFAAHPRAAAFRWRRIGLMAGDMGDYRLARLAFRRSFHIQPSPRTLWHLTRSARVSTRRLSEAWSLVGTEVS